MIDVIKSKELPDYIVSYYLQIIDKKIKTAALDNSKYCIVTDYDVHKGGGCKIIQNKYDKISEPCPYFEQITEKLYESGYDICFERHNSKRWEMGWFWPKCVEYSQIGLKIYINKYKNKGEWVEEWF